VKGVVDDALRALVTVSIGSSRESPKQAIALWVDTAFNGTLVIPRQVIEKLGLQKATVTEATLADGSTVALETFTCYLDWIGTTRRTQAIANDGYMPLLGTMLLAGQLLTIDYENRFLELA
jgi:clan AA aspartic protease